MRTVLHSDLNNFYASVECLKNPQIRNFPVVVVGSIEDRHGVVLAKNMIAKNLGVKTGDVYWQAKQKCGNTLVEVPADFSTYINVSREVRKIYEDYADRIQAYGIDECWLDVTSSVKLFGGGRQIAERIRERIKTELGLTVSIGVSWNKIFAKLGSDMKKPDAVTEITPENYKQVVWSLPVEDLLYVGKATQKKLNRIGVKTIGDLATADEKRLLSLLGKWGGYLHAFANGEDNSPVLKIGEEQAIKSIGNSLTVYRDLTDDEDVEPVIWLLSDSVCARMREAGLDKARTVCVYARDNKLNGFRKQGRLPRPSGNMRDLATAALKLFREAYSWDNPVRSLGITASGFVNGDEQLDMFGDGEKDERQRRLDDTIDKLRSKYGNNIIQTANILKDEKLKELDIKGEHTIHPYSFFSNNK